MRRLLGFVCVILLLFCAIAHAETEFKIITLQHRFASDLLPVITPMVGAEGTATGIDNQLILRASPERMREIEQVVNNLDAARVNRRITIKSNQVSQSQQQTIDAEGNIKRGNVTIRNSRRIPSNSGRVTLDDSSQHASHNLTQFINVIDGERGFIRVGQIVPYSEDWIAITRQYISVYRSTDWREISTGFTVRTRTIGNQVEVEITPRIASMNGQGFVDFESLSTTLHTTLGTWLDIAGTMQNNDEVSRKILGQQHNASYEDSTLSIKID
jgi:hypothetical protein